MSQPTLTVKDASGTTQTVFTHNPNGPAAAVNSQPVVLASDSPALPVALDAPSLAALEHVSIDNFPTTQTVSGTVALDSATLAALENISIDNAPGLTNAQLRASAVPVSLASTPGLTDAQLRAAAVPVTQTAIPLPTGAGETDRSGTITAGGTAQTIMAANAARKYFELQNLDASNTLYFRKDGAAAVIGAAGSFALAVGAFYSGQSTGAVSVIGATTGHKFSAVEA